MIQAEEITCVRSEDPWELLCDAHLNWERLVEAGKNTDVEDKDRRERLRSTTANAWNRYQRRLSNFREALRAEIMRLSEATDEDDGPLFLSARQEEVCSTDWTTRKETDPHQ